MTPHPLISGIDGLVALGELPRDGCCPPALCDLTESMFVCRFVELLPRGPLWDEAKIKAAANYVHRLNAEPPEPTGVSMVDFSVFTAVALHHSLKMSLWPALRESDPDTAVTTLDRWLTRFSWRDCFDCACRDPDFGNALTPVEIWGAIDADGLCEVPVCCPIAYPAELQAAVKRGTVRALARLELGPPHTLDALNFVIAPLSAKLEFGCYRDETIDPGCEPDDGMTLCLSSPVPVACPEDEETDPNACVEAEEECPGQETFASACAPTRRVFEIRIVKTADEIEGVPSTGCPGPDNRGPPDPIAAYYDATLCDEAETERRLWPGLMAAECIVRSILPIDGSIKLTRGY